jgi:RND superfamily putative drug exporter
MFQALGNFVSRRWLMLLIGWSAAFVVFWWVAPPWSQLAEDVQFGLLPENVPSRAGEAFFKKAFPLEQIGSNVVLLIERDQTHTGPPDREKKFVEQVLEPGLRQIADLEGGLASETQPEEGENPFAEPGTTSAPTQQRSIIAQIETPNAPGTGPLLVSEDGKALLVVVDLTTEFGAARNWPTIAKIEDLVRRASQDERLPTGDRILLTGSAVVGRDHSRAELEAAHAIGIVTILLALVLLMLIYRAPYLALVPLVTVYLAVQMSIHVLTLLAQAGYLMLFQGLEIYIAIICYGAGIDYYLLLAARYREELDSGANPELAAARAIGKTGAALAASAGTVMGGIAMLSFAQFGRFRQAGIAIPISIFIVLTATFSFSIPLLRLAGEWAFWPYRRRQADSDRAAPGSPDGLSIEGFLLPTGLAQIWARIGRILERRPVLTWTCSVLVLAPFAVAGILLGEKLNFDPIGDLPADVASVAGTRALEAHFPAGILGPVTVLLIEPGTDFKSAHGRELAAEISKNLQARSEALGLADVRSLTAPLGITETAKHAFDGSDLPKEGIEQALERLGTEHYTTDLGERAKVGTRLDLILKGNPFSTRSIANMPDVEKTVAESLPHALQGGQLFFLGTTASCFDLMSIEQQDRLRIQVLVVGAVFVILLLLLRKLLVSLYLILSVLFSFYATLGVTFALFWMLDPKGFTGLDWRVSIFLFTILIAVGEDYNIFLMSRIHEEQQRLGPVRGILEALVRTGAVISSAGIIMAGTFASLLAGSLTEMKQLGFALAFGVLLDTFVVRPVLVPAFLIWLERRRCSTVPSISTGPGSSRPENIHASETFNGNDGSHS